MNEIQLNIVEGVLGLKDEAKLAYLLDLVNTLKFPEPYELSEAQSESIRISRQQIENGDFIQHETVMGKMKEWLDSK